MKTTQDQRDEVKLEKMVKDKKITSNINENNEDKDIKDLKKKVLREENQKYNWLRAQLTKLEHSPVNIIYAITKMLDQVGRLEEHDND